MLVVVALSGTALLRRGEAPTVDHLRRSVAQAAAAIAPVAARHQLVITLDATPQPALLALEAAEHSMLEGSYSGALTFETEELISYMLEQELGRVLPADRPVATLLTMAEVDPDDPAFEKPTTAVGPLYLREESEDLAARRGWVFRPEGDKYRRVVASPLPVRIVELGCLTRLIHQHVVVIARGGGGLPTVASPQRFPGTGCAIDADMAAAVLASDLEADRFVLLTEADGIYLDWGEPGERQIRVASPDALCTLMAGERSSMAAPVAAACHFVTRTGRPATIGAVPDLLRLLHGDAGTTIVGQAAASTVAEPPPQVRSRPHRPAEAPRAHP
jgi:carbamate kinase